MRRWGAAGAAVLVTAACAVVVLSTGGERATVSAQAPPASTAAVERGDLSSVLSLAGTLTYRAQADGSPYSVINRASGTYTELPEAGDRLACGDVLYRVDERPVLLLCGDVPAYRDLRMGDAGRDVRQLNRNLHGLGQDVDPRDRRFTWRTARALRRLQERRRCDPTGALAAGDAVVLPRPGRIFRVTGRLGAPARPGAQVAQATSGTLQVQVELEAAQQGEVREGDRARVTLPGNGTVRGRVSRLGRVARAQGKGAAATVPAFIMLEDPGKARGLDRAPVRVDVATRGVQDALSVPATALVGRVGGGFAVEVARPGGRRELVAVRLGLFDTGGGRVEVEGALAEGDRVVVPSP